MCADDKMCDDGQTMVTLRKELDAYPTSIDQDVEILNGGLSRREAFAGERPALGPLT